MADITRISFETKAANTQNGHWFRRTWTKKSVRMTVFILLALTLTAAVFLITPLGQELLGRLNAQKSMNGPKITHAQYDHVTEGSGDCTHTRLVLGNFAQSETLGCLTFHFEKLYMTLPYYDDVYSLGDIRYHVTTEVKVTHAKGKNKSENYLPEHKMQFVVVAEKQNVPVMNLYFDYWSTFEGGGFYYAPKYDEEEYLYTSNTGTFPWELNGCYLHYALCGFDVYNASHLMSQYGSQLIERYNARVDERMKLPYDVNENKITQMTPELFNTLDGYDLIMAIRPDSFVISYIALESEEYASVRTVYDPDSSTVSETERQSWSFYRSFSEEDGLATEYLVIDSRSVSLHSLTDPKHYNPPQETVLYDWPIGFVDPDIEQGEEFARVFAPFIHIINKNNQENN